jgi:hypothetical protein
VPPQDSRRPAPNGSAIDRLLKPLGAAPPSFWWKVLPAFALAAIVSRLLPRGGHGAQPPVGTLLLAAVLVTALTTGALYLGLRTDLRLPARVALYAVGWNALVVLVKFVLAPHGMYEVNQKVEFQDIAPSDTFGAILTAVVVFALYGIAFAVIYRVLRRQLQRPPRGPRSRRRRSILVSLIVGVLVLATLGWAIVIIPLFAVAAASQYLNFVFSSSVSLLVALALAGATALATLALRDVRDRSQVLGDATVLATFFWVGLAFLALYHVLWVVYVLALTATWPLRVVVPK